MEISLISSLITMNISGAVIYSLIDPSWSFVFPDESAEDEALNKRRNHFVDALKFVRSVVGHSLLVFTWILGLINIVQALNKGRHLKTQNEVLKEDLMRLLSLSNVIFFNSDVRMKKQSILARAFFNYKDLAKYKWDRSEDDHDAFWETESLSKFELNDDTEDEYFMVADRIEFFKKNFPKKLEELNGKYIFFDRDNFLNETITDDQIKHFQKRFDKITN